MRIARLELRGFKSFPDRTLFEFGPGVSCVVGPNGCGKSNIVDALRWVIGEQSARSLRAADMADVIFAGSMDRSPVGFAEVGLGLSSDVGEPFPGEYAALHEIGVCRRLHRNGTSEYLINGVRARRRDVVELFLDTGIGNNLYSFIEQGQIDKLVHASPEDRRGLIDEAAGISRYKARRDEALERLAQTGAQLDRAADLADEMGRRLGTLEKAVWAAASFRRLRALIRQDEILLSLVKYADAVEERRAARDRSRHLDAQVARALRAVEEVGAELVLRRNELDVAEAAATLRRDEVADLEARRRELEGARGFHERRRSELGDRQARLQALAEAAGVERDAADGEVVAHEAAQADARNRLAGCEQSVDAASGRVEVAASQRRVLREAHSQASDRGAECDRRSLALQAAAEATEARLASVPVARARLAEQQGLLDQRIASLDSRLEQLRASLGACTDARDAAVAAVAEADGRARAAATDEEVGRAAVRNAEASAVEARQDGVAGTVAAEVAARAAATAAGQAERDAVARAEEWITAVRQEATRALDLLRRQARLDEDAAERRHATAVADATAETEQAERVAEAEWGSRFRACDAESRAALTTAEDAGIEAVRGAEAAEATVGRARIQSLEVEATRLETDLQAARTELGTAAATASRTRAAHAAEEAAWAALRARAREEAARVAGAGEIAETLADPRPLVQRLSPDEAASTGALVGDRLNLPVAATASEVLSSAKKVKSRVSLIFSSGDPLSVLLRGVRVVDDLASALAHWEATGEAAVVRSTGERVGVDGVVEIGPAGPVEGLGTVRALALAPTRVAEAASLAAEADRRLVDAEVQVAALGAAAEPARSEVRVMEAEVRERIARAADGARQVAAMALDQVRAAVAERWAQVERARDGERAGERERRAGALQAMQTAHRREAEHTRESGQGGIDGLVAAAAAAERAQAAATREALSDLRAEGSHAAQQADRAVVAARERLRDVEARSQEGLACVRERAEGLREARGGAERELADQRARLADASADLQLALRDGDAAGLERVALIARAGELEGEQRALDATEEAWRAEVAVATSAARLGRQALEVARRAGEEARRASEGGEFAEEEARAGLRTEEVGCAEVREQVRSAALAASLARRRAEEAGARLVASEGEWAETVGSLAAAAGERERCAADAAQVDDARALAVEQLQGERDRVARTRGALREIEERTRTVSVALDAERSAQAETAARLERVSAEVDGLRRRIDERYQLSLSGLLDRVFAGGVELGVDPAVNQGLEVAGRAVPGVEARRIRPGDLLDADRIAVAVADVEQHRADLALLGEVNLTALTEYDDLRDRHAELAAQRSDLDESVATLRAAIARMNRECRQRFREAFDRVNEHFQLAYPRLVGGGSARLALTDEEDLLEAGVEIFVQPPGKRLQNLTLLSGGEKAMTAIALLISLFQVKPSPFCVLDEVDAPLDEANGGRFNDMLREMSRASQFIVVTHNRKTMECADVLFGVTMARPGVSRLVSVEI